MSTGVGGRGTATALVGAGLEEDAKGTCEYGKTTALLLVLEDNTRVPSGLINETLAVPPDLSSEVSRSFIWGRGGGGVAVRGRGFEKSMDQSTIGPRFCSEASGWLTGLQWLDASGGVAVWLGAFSSLSVALSGTAVTSLAAAEVCGGLMGVTGLRGVEFRFRGGVMGAGADECVRLSNFLLKWSDSEVGGISAVS